MALIISEQFSDLESCVRARLEELFEDRYGHPLWEPTDAADLQGYPSEMMFLCDTGD